MFVHWTDLDVTDRKIRYFLFHVNDGETANRVYLLLYIWSLFLFAHLKDIVPYTTQTNRHFIRQFEIVQ